MVLWKDGSADWIQLKDIKDSNLVEVAEYAFANHIQDNQEFSLWVFKVLRYQNKIISKVKSNYLRTTHNFGIRFPNNVDEEFRIDKEVDNDYWEKSLHKETSKVKVACKQVNGVAPYQSISVSNEELIAQ